MSAGEAWLSRLPLSSKGLGARGAEWIAGIKLYIDHDECFFVVYSSMFQCMMLTMNDTGVPRVLNILTSTLRDRETRDEMH